MRADFNITCVLYDGPGTATPGFPRVVDAQCRLVPDPYFKDVDAPLSASLAYFTIAAAAPRGPVNTDLGGGIYQFDFTRADRVEFSSAPTVIFVVLRTELCTWPKPGAPYWRSSIAEDASPVNACQLAYHEAYTLHGFSGPPSGTVVSRITPTLWIGDDYVLEAELTPPNESCDSLWRLHHGTEVWEAISNGTFVQTFDPVSGVAYQCNVFPAT